MNNEKKPVDTKKAELNDSNAEKAAGGLLTSLKPDEDSNAEEETTNNKHGLLTKLISDEQPSPGSGNCVLAGTLILMANGAEKPVEDIRRGDIVKAWDFETGSYINTEVLHNFHLGQPARHAYIIEAEFSDGTKISIVNKHGFFDATTGEYITMDKNAEKYIGHKFMRTDGNGFTTASLVSVSVREETVRAYSPVTKKCVNCVNNGFISVPAYFPMLLNGFEVDVSTMKYINTASDIKKYGLMSFDAVKHLGTKALYDALNAKIFSISFGKGNSDIKSLENAMNTFSDDIKILNAI